LEACCKYIQTVLLGFLICIYCFSNFFMAILTRKYVIAINAGQLSSQSICIIIFLV
jgi:hypothetical protein